MTVHWHDDHCGYCPCDEPTVTVEDGLIWRTDAEGHRQQVGTLARDGADWFAHDDQGNWRLERTRTDAVRALLAARRLDPNEYTDPA